MGKIWFWLMNGLPYNSIAGPPSGLGIERVECYLLVPAGEADAKDARIAELERQLAERSPGVMPEAVRALCSYYDGKKRVDQQFHDLAKSVEAHYAPPAGHRWEPVYAEHLITADDVGRKVASHCGGVLFVDEWRAGCFVAGGLMFRPSGRVLGKDEICSHDITHILRPIAPPFVFDGSPGRYRTDDGKECAVWRCGNRLVGIIEDEAVRFINADGTFAGGRITGRVSE